jgi:DNA polymerase-2
MYIRVRDRAAAERVFSTAGGRPPVPGDSELTAFDGAPCCVIRADRSAEIGRLQHMLSERHIETFRYSSKGAGDFLTENNIRGGIRISGEVRQGRGADLVFPDPEIVPDNTIRIPLTVLSLDIETDERTRQIRSVGISCVKGQSSDRYRRVLFQGEWRVPDIPLEVTITSGERELLELLVREIQTLDPDIITGWNVIDFDFPRLYEAFERKGVSFTLGRSVEAGNFFPAEVDGSAPGEAKRSAAVFLPGRQVLDALRMVRTNHEQFESYTLDSVSRNILGIGKTIQLTDGEKLAEIDRLYMEDQKEFCRYCLMDADLVLDILEKRQLIEHTIARAALTGAGIDKAWTSVASFERVYAGELRRRGILEPNPDGRRKVSGAAGGTVLPPSAGLFRQVAVFDFRSLYPSIMRTFNIDPLAYERAAAASPSGDRACSGRRADEYICAPNGAKFSREPGILPGLIGEYFSERIKAIEQGDEAAAYVYKILMNSFYGVLGTPKCRYARTELAGAITSFGKKILLFARDFFADRGYCVLYGDTDSVFVETGSGDRAEQEACSGLYADLEAGLNRELAESIRNEYGVESFIAIRFEKLYRRFFIPWLRSTEGGNRGRAKGYAGLRLSGDGSSSLEIKGMEAARSDYTDLARRFQRELLGLLFSDADPAVLQRFIRTETEKLYRGELDSELVFRKKLRRIPEKYTASTPPHVKVARALGWENRRGTVEYLLTENGPEALSQHDLAAYPSPIDYDYYAETQLLPTARAVGMTAGFDAQPVIRSVSDGGQLEFDLS